MSSKNIKSVQNRAATNPEEEQSKKIEVSSLLASLPSARRRPLKIPTTTKTTAAIEAVEEQILEEKKTRSKSSTFTERVKSPTYTERAKSPSKVERSISPTRSEREVITVIPKEEEEVKLSTFSRGRTSPSLLEMLKEEEITTRGRSLSPELPTMSRATSQKLAKPVSSPKLTTMSQAAREKAALKIKEMRERSLSPKLPTMSRKGAEIEESPVLLKNPIEESPEIISKASKIRPPQGIAISHELKNTAGVVYLLVKVNSNLPLQIIVDFFEDLRKIGSDGKPLVDTEGLPVVGCARVEHRRMNPREREGRYYIDDYYQYKETSFSILAVHPLAVATLRASDYWVTRENRFGNHGIAVQQYKIIPTNNYPPPKCEPALYCGFKDPQIIPIKESIRQLYMKMANMEECGFVKATQYEIHIPLLSRDGSGFQRNFAIITFNDEVDLDNRAKIKVSLDQTNYRGEFDEEAQKYIPSICRVAWANSVVMPSIRRSKRTTESRVSKFLQEESKTETFTRQTTRKKIIQPTSKSTFQERKNEEKQEYEVPKKTVRRMIKTKVEEPEEEEEEVPVKTKTTPRKQ